ncbi:MAG: hypothetical protein JNL87_06115 [Burkholderiaceae bacterium]|nr:hypothetical protein [Burkholderiaceae bacterium]
MRKILFVSILSAGLMAGCGSGGGDEAAAAPATPATPTADATVALSGTAAKGLMANADVGVYAVNADGSLGSTPLATTTTDAQGKYSLSFAGFKDQPYVIRVSANAGTTHLDEVSGAQQPLPAGFVMRSLVVPAATGTVTTSASITPFSEMAVAAAAKASGGITAANAAQAVSTVTQLLGFNPIGVEAKTTADAAGASADEQKLAIMLAAVSQLASNGDLGCSSGSAGDKTKCVVDALGASSTTTSIKLGSGAAGSATDVSGALSSAIGTVLANPVLAGTISSATLATVVANLGCTTGCDAAPVGTTPTVDKTATAIAGAKLLFAGIKSDWSAMFSRHGSSSIATGAANLEASKFESAMRDVHVPVRTLLQDSGALLMGIDLYNDYKAGRTTLPGRGRVSGQVPNNGSADFSGYTAVGCTLYQDSGSTVTATAPSNANYIGCSARYYLTRTYIAATASSPGTFNTNEYRHGFTITPNTDGSFGWLTRARLRVTAANGATLSNAALQTVDGTPTGTPIDPFAGTVTPTATSANGDIVGFTMTGDWAAGFEEGGSALMNHHHTVSLSGTRVTDPNTAHLETATVSGSLVAKDGAGAVLSTLTVRNASLSSAPVSRDAHGNIVSPTAPTAVSPAGGELSGGALNLVFSTPQAEFEGLFEIGASAWDKSGTELLPTRLKISGALRNIEAGTPTEFLAGVFTASSSGYAGFDATQPYSATNRWAVDVSFVGTVSAPKRPAMEVSFGATQLIDSDDGHTQGMTLQYRTLVGGKPRMVVSVAASPDPASGKINRFKLTEASAGLTMEWLADAAKVDLLHDGAVIGEVDTGSGLLTFKDGSFVSLDIGL